MGKKVRFFELEVGDRFVRSGIRYIKIRPEGSTRGDYVVNLDTGVMSSLDRTDMVFVPEDEDTDWEKMEWEELEMDD
ncbi:MAG: hypothetical protein ACOC5T_05185 [Elusimicrobiota bacterium]